ncbi:hypothetical protein PISMIDRAFT_13312 [Pisolithus microcarpus 441]|uniref:Uncharacterized protein n=1 Tax=Pisolithus microcarpus 441 TaxID=765257 RepID=A0A0C9ZBX1_9AGAM|nr:hypothetical protein BKA83DRAFT_13312 [Pisolithus microcarpus]KIK19952.1 hypothetical protein PISMIDRAFT_13312 [Pisolithus microcarpus 441]
MSQETPPTARRKSVRMSLQPTSSPPPAPVTSYDQFDEDDHPSQDGQVLQLVRMRRTFSVCVGELDVA